MASPGFINTREALVARSKPLLEPGEVIAHLVKATEGINRWAGIGIAVVIGFGLGAVLRSPLLGLPIFFLVFTRLYARRLILATDRSVVVVGCGRWRFTPRQVLDRLDLETPIGPLKGLFLNTTLNGRRLYVVARSAAEVTAADADLEE